MGVFSKKCSSGITTCCNKHEVQLSSSSYTQARAIESFMAEPDWMAPSNRHLDLDSLAIT
jgi:hypothetical protein